MDRPNERRCGGRASGRLLFLIKLVDLLDSSNMHTYTLSMKDSLIFAKLNLSSITLGNVKVMKNRS